MMELIYSSIFIFFTYLISGTILFLLIIKFFNNYKYFKLIYIVSLGTGPIAISWVLEKTMYTLIGYPKELYISIIFLLFSLLFLYSLNSLNNIKQAYIILSKQFTKVDIIISILILAILSLNILLPVITNDSSQYYYVSRNIFEAMDFHQYPLVASDAYKGYFPWTHPAGYVSLLTWGYFFSDGTEHLYLLKTVNVFYAFLTYILMTELLNRYGSLYSKVGALLIFMSPLYCTLIGAFHIDIFRVFLFFTPFVLLSIAMKEKDVKLLYILVISLGFSAYAHSIGILSILFAGVIILVYLRKQLTLKNILIMVGILIVMLASRYYQNYQLFGYVIGDKSAISALDFLHYDDFLAQSRQLDGLYNIITNGIFRGFTHPNSFAMTFQYIVAISLLTLIKDKFTKKDILYTFKSLLRVDHMFKISLWLLTLWYFLTIISTLLGGYNFIKNDRYLLTIYPFIIYLSLILTFELIKVRKKVLTK